MFRLRLSVPLRALVLAIAVNAPAAPAAAQTTPGSVRVVDRAAPILRWFRAPIRDVLTSVEPGTTLEVLDKERGWLWVIAPPDAHGTRRSGWIDARNVEVVIEPAIILPPQLSQRDEAGSAASVFPQASPAPAAVTVTESRGRTASDRANAPAARKEYKFEDVHFDRDGDSLRPEEKEILDTAATALKADPRLGVNIEGYTCSLGTPAYNLALGARRANSVKDYLMSEGVAADRLRTVSFGEERASHDNSREEARRLNRRVALVPNAQP